MNLQPTKTGPVEAPRGATMKFTYASGSSPLEGYTIKRGIGRGGFGEVYYATSDAGKEVALKLIRRNLDVELRGVRQCLNLKHSNLVGLYDIKTDAMDDRWVVMEHVCGESLEDAVERNPNGMPIDQVLYWMETGDLTTRQLYFTLQDLDQGRPLRTPEQIDKIPRLFNEQPRHLLKPKEMRWAPQFSKAIRNYKIW